METDRFAIVKPVSGALFDEKPLANHAQQPPHD